MLAQWLRQPLQGPQLSGQAERASAGISEDCRPDPGDGTSTGAPPVSSARASSRRGVRLPRARLRRDVAALGNQISAGLLFAHLAHTACHRSMPQRHKPSIPLISQRPDNRIVSPVLHASKHLETRQEIEALRSGRSGFLFPRPLAVLSFGEDNCSARCRESRWILRP